MNGKWTYLYRAVDSRGHSIEFYLSPRRNTKAAYLFLRKIFDRVKRWQILRVINTDKASPYSRALNPLKEEGKCPTHVEHRQIKFHNNVIECDHGKLKRVINPTLEFKSIKTAHATIKGIEVMHALREGQAEHLLLWSTARRNAPSESSLWYVAHFELKNSISPLYLQQCP